LIRAVGHPRGTATAEPLPDLDQYERDLEALAAFERDAESDLERSMRATRWTPTDYERVYLPHLRLVGIPDKDRIVLQNSADLHMHTEWSDGDLLDRVLERAIAARQDVIAITDQDEIEGALEARRRVHHRRLPLAVVPGVEVSSADGHIGALFVTRPIPKGLPADETIHLIHEAGGLAVAHHPYVPRWIEFVLGQKLGCRDLIRHLPFDAIECTNAVPGRGSRYNLQAVRSMEAHHIRRAVTGSSDAHIAALVGKGRTWFGGNEGVVSLQSAMAHGFTQGSEGYWSTREKLAYYSHLFIALARNTIRRYGSVN
jgi:predicted metal-dependent phosphoesterase TrpH